MELIADLETRKYREMWKHKEYSNSPSIAGIDYFNHHLSECVLAAGNDFGWMHSAVDFGCGDGQLLLHLHELGLKDLVGVDLDDFGPRDRHSVYHLICAPLWDEHMFDHLTMDVGYCIDVMEHIPEAFSMLCIRNMLECVNFLVLSIAFGPDSCGQLIGQQLHVNQKPYTWWVQHLRDMGYVWRAIDRGNSGLFIVSSGRA